MPPSPPPSVYMRLGSERKEIRLLSICRTNDPTDLIECDFQTFELNTAPPFDALSYVWGDLKITTEIKVGGISIQITTNLCAALKRLREKADVQWIWADALCIYPGRHRTKYRRNLRVEPPFCKGLVSTHLACRTEKGSINYFVSQLRLYP